MSKRLNMSNDEAVEWLLSLKDLDICGENRNTAIDKAVTALKSTTCEDCISREAVNALVDELARAISDERCCISRGRSTATIMRDILHLPSVTPQPKKEGADDR